MLLLLVLFAVNSSLVVIKLREGRPSRTFCAPTATPILGAVVCLGLMPFVPEGSLLTAVAILVLGAGLVWTRRRLDD